MGRVNSSAGHNEAESRFEKLARVCGQAVLVLADSKVVFASDAAVGMFGAVRPDQLLGASVDRIRLDADTVLPTPDVQNPQHAGAQIHRIDGEVLAVGAAAVGCQYRGADGTLVVLGDLGERQRLEGRLRFLVRHDVLTELPNRTEFRERLSGAMARAQRASRQVAVMLINIDRFRTVNSRFGAEIGDLLLQEVALRLKVSVREADSVARVSADEFGLILEAIDERQQTTVVANRVLAKLREPFNIGGERIEITASAGIAAFPHDTRDITALLRMSDVAMYAAKESGGGVFRLYFPEFEERSRRDQARREQIAARIATLTEREHEVMEVLIEGNSSKAIAYMLGASPRTIENHRAKVMSKMQADSLPDLVRMVLDAKRT